VRDLKQNLFTNWANSNRKFRSKGLGMVLNPAERDEAPFIRAQTFQEKQHSRTPRQEMGIREKKRSDEKVLTK